MAAKYKPKVIVPRILTCEMDIYGVRRWYNASGQLHRIGGPAVEGPTGDKQWYINGKLHRENGPAVEWAAGDKSWWLHGVRHRADGPALEKADGTKMWFVDGQLHRSDGPAIEYSDGTKEWHLKGIKQDLKPSQPTNFETLSSVRKAWQQYRESKDYSRIGALLVELGKILDCN